MYHVIVSCLAMFALIAFRHDSELSFIAIILVNMHFTMRGILEEMKGK